MIVIADSCNAIYGGISKRTFKFNKNRQAYEQKCYGLHNQPASVKNGAHRILYEYDKHGNVHDVKAYGVDGRPAKIDGQYYSHQTVRYDSSGNMVEFHQYDENGRPVSVGTEVSSYFREYDSNGNLINSTEYSSTPDGGEEVSYRLISKSDSSFHYFSDGSIKTLAYDKRGRMVLYKLTEADNKLSHDVDHPYSTYEYTDRPDGSVVTVEKEYLPSGTLKQIYVTDSLNLVREWYELDSLGRMTDGNRQKFDESWANVLWQENINLQGKVVRRSSSSAPLSYRVEIEKTISGDYINFHGVDEFGEDDYMCFNGMVPGVYNLHNVTHNAGFSPLTDDFKEVKTSTKNSVSKYMTIEVVDSAAYALGIRDNDIILQYGESFMADPMNSLWRFLGEWSMGEILETPHEKVMRVFRIDSVKPERCSIRDIRLPAGTSRELGFLAHLCYRTKKQDERVKKTMSDAEFSIDINPSGKLTIHVVFPDMSMQYRYQAYGEKVGVPSIVLKAEVLEIPGLKWKIGDDFFLLENIKEAVDEDGSLTLLFHYFDGNKIRTEVYSPEADRSNLYLTGAPIGEDGYESFKKMAAVLKDTPAKELTDTLKFKVADALWNNNLKNEAVKIYESMPYDQVRQNSPRLYSYYKNQPKKKKMAKFYRDVAINELSGRKEPTAHDIESLANIYAEKDSVKAAEYIANSIRDYDAGLKNQLDVYDDVAYLLKAIAAYQHAAPYEYASARLYAAFRFVFMGGNKEYIFNNYLKPLYESRQLMRPDCNGWALYGLLLRELSQQDDRYASAYLKYKRNTVHYFTPTDDGAASQKGMSGRYKLLKINDWNLADGVTWHEISEQALDIPKQVVFMDEAGNIIEQDFDGRMGGMISIEGPAE